MEDILEQLACYARERVKIEKEKVPFTEVRAVAESLPKGWFPFTSAIKRKGLSFICEVKKASPSKGIISEDFPYLQIAKDYEEAGAEAISVLTEPKWFMGDNSYLSEIAENIRTPIIRKDFTVDPYMIYEAKCIGAQAVLLICSLLDEKELNEYLIIAKELGLSALVEAHDEAEIEFALGAGAEIIGVNNRNLRDFSVDTGNARRLRSLVPNDVLFVSESGISGPSDIVDAKQAGVDAVLVGESLMKALDRKAFLKRLREAN